MVPAAWAGIDSTARIRHVPDVDGPQSSLRSLHTPESTAS